MTLSILVSVVVLSDGTLLIPGFALGAEGLALKLVLMQIISVNMGLYFLSKTKVWKFDWHYQVYSPTIVLLVSFMIYWLVKSQDLSNVFTEFVTYALLYTISIGLMVLYLGKPMLGFELKDYLRKFKIGGSNG
jgi:hypothetical protein